MTQAAQAGPSGRAQVEGAGHRWTHAEALRLLDLRTAPEVAVVMALVTLALPTGVCWARVGTIAELARVNHRTCQRALKQLEERGLLHRWRTSNPDRLSFILRQ